MTKTELLVLAASLSAIVWVNWYFFVAGRSAAVAASAVSADATPEIVIEVDGGYNPNVVQGRVGQPLRLIFDRKDDSSCSEEIVMPDFGVRRFLPTGQRTTVEITPTTKGRHAFTCGMGMLRGTVVVDA